MSSIADYEFKVYTYELPSNTGVGIRHNTRS